MPPRERQKLQPRSLDVLGNLSDRYYREGNVEGMRRMGQELQNRLQNHQSLQPGTGTIFNTSPIEGGPIGPGSYWNVGLQSGDNSGIISAAMANHPRMQQVKSLYENFDPWIPNLDGDSLGYEWERPLLGGTLGYGFDYDMGDEGLGAFLNWKLGIGT